MKEGIYPAIEVYPDFYEGSPEVPQDRHFVIHSHIGSTYDRLIQELAKDRIISGLPGSPGDLFWTSAELVDAKGHEVVNKNPKWNQAQNLNCYLYKKES